MHFLFRASIAALFCSVVGVAAAPSDTDFFPIMPWNSPPNDPEVLKKIHECGFTIAGFVPPAALDNCQKAGLKAIVSDARVSGYEWSKVDETKARTNVASLIAEVGQHPAV